MIDKKGVEIGIMAVYNRLRELNVLQVPLRDSDVELIVRDLIKLIKAQEIAKIKLAKLKLLKE